MPVPKGTNNFHQSKRLKMDNFKKKLELELGKLREKKSIFKNQNHINEVLAELLNINKSTLYRTEEYKSLILAYLEQQPIRGSSKSNASDSVKIAELQIELSNAKHEIGVLRRYIENLNTQVDATPAKQALPAADNLDFQKTAQVLALLLEATEGQFILEQGCLLDMTKRTNNQVASQQLVTPFAKWFKAQESPNG